MVKGRSDGEETKKRITATAKELFIRKGYGAVSMNEVCEAAEVSKGSLYHHFKSKEELFLQVIEEDSQRWSLEWERIREGAATVEEQLYALAEHYASDFQNPLLAAQEEFARSRAITDVVFDRLLRISDNNSQACRSVLREGMEKGELARGDLDRSVILVSSMLEGLGKLYYAPDLAKQQDKVREYYRDAVRLLLEGIRAKATL
ncbi:TetR/AcrR family transcriptional regulator [Cohnella hongkongensis]|uniref:TetR/AcrR family transcriptional regulator n=1 Tax=Cohnella hongkongensis TaxID=178337 RepID=A0ABV9FFD4_9BACL